MELPSEVRFGDETLKKTYAHLENGTFEDKQLKLWLEDAVREIRKNAFCGIQIPKRLIPKEYQQKFGSVDNLWKYNLPDAWRLIYTIKKEEILLLAIVIEWLDHKEYDRKFKY